MTEYDYSPEAYERYLATQTRIANWVDTTEAHRAEFQHALNAVPPTAPTIKVPAPPAGARPARPPHAHRPPPLPLPQFGTTAYYAHGTQPHSASSDGLSIGMGYDPVSGPGPMLHPARRSTAYAPPPAYAPLLPPGAHQPVLYRPAQTHRASHHSSHSHSHSRRHHSSGSPGGYYPVASPPVSPPYAYPPAPGPAHAHGQRGYFVVQPQHPVRYMS